VAAHADDASRSQPHEHTTRQRGFPEGMSCYRLQLQSRRQARHHAASTARAHSGSRVVVTRGGGSRLSGLLIATVCRTPAQLPDTSAA
jgi:hypothetical protein